jgi:hypothetical protein
MSAMLAEVPKQQPEAVPPAPTAQAPNLLTIHLRTAEAFAAAQGAALDGLLAVMRQQAEAGAAAVGRGLDAAQGILAQPDPRARLRKGFEALRAAMQDGIGDAGMLAEVGARAGAEAAQILQDRALGLLDEIEATLEPLLEAPAPGASASAPAR